MVNGGPGLPRPRDGDDERRDEPVRGEVLGSRRDDEPLLGGAPRRLMVPLLVVAALIGVVLPTVVLLLVDDPAGWAVVRVGTGAGVLVAMVGWRILRVLHRAGRLR